MGVDYDEPHLAEKFASKVHMYTLPRFRGPFPRVQGSLGGLVAMLLAAGASRNSGFDVLINVRPPHVATGELFHSDDATMGAVQFTQNSRLQLRRYNNSRTPQYATVVRRQLGPALGVSRIAVSEVTGLYGMVDGSQGRVPARFETNLLSRYR